MSDVIRPIPSQSDITQNTPEAQPDERDRRSNVLGTLARVALGGTLLAVELLIDQLEKLEEQESTQTLPKEKPLEAVLIPAEEWDTTVGHALEQPPRHLLLGLTLATGSRLSQAVASLRRGERALGSALDTVFSPFRTSRVLSPVRGGFEDLVEQGQNRVARWRELGRAEEARSRALAQVFFTRVIDDSAEVVARDARVQELVREVIAGQGMGMADEAIEEVRERTITGDILLERPVRSLLRRPPRESLPAPTEIIKNLPKPGAKGRG